jgi:hypothetical protein
MKEQRMRYWRTFLVTIAMVATLASPAAAETQLDKVSNWILAFIHDAAPPGRKIYYPEGQETVDAAEERYKSIATDIVDVAYNPHTTPVFKGKNGRTQTIALILSVMYHESSFMRHVDYGLGKYARGDHGKSWCMMQVKIEDERTPKWNYVKDRAVHWGDPKEEIRDGYTGEELVADRKLCIAEGIRIMRGSFSSCRRLPLEDRLRQYASGNCEDGADASHNRVNMAMSWYAKTYKGEFTDTDIMDEMKDAWRQQLLGAPIPVGGPPDGIL